MASITGSLSAALGTNGAHGKKHAPLVWLCLTAPWNEACQAWRRDVLNHPDLQNAREEFTLVEIACDADPALDAAAQFALQSLAGRSGWPANLFLDPVSGHPVFGAPALTLESARELLWQLARAWRADPAALREQAAETAAELLRHDPLRASPERAPLNESEVRAWLDPKIEGAWLTPLEQSLDFDTGIVGQGEVFQFPAVYKCLLQNPALADWAEIAAGNLAKSHLCDAIGGGFYRSGGRLPEAFVATEKLLAENAELLEVFVQCKGTGFPRQVAADLVQLLLAEFRAESGLASSLAGRADHYRVTPSELLGALEPAQRQPAQMFFGIESTHAVPFLQTDLPMLSSFLKLPPVDLQHLLLDAKKRLARLRESKSKPARGPRLRCAEATALRALAQATEAGLLNRAAFQSLAEPMLEDWARTPSDSPRAHWAQRRAQLALARLSEPSRRWSLIQEVDEALVEGLGAESVQVQGLTGWRWDFLDHLGASSGALRLQALLDRMELAEIEGDRRGAEFWGGALRPLLADALRISKPLGLYGASVFEAYQRYALRQERRAGLSELRV